MKMGKMNQNNEIKIIKENNKSGIKMSVSFMLIFG